MSCGSKNSFMSPIHNVEDVQDRSVSELIGSLPGILRRASFEEVQKVLEVMQRRWDHEVEHLRSKNESLNGEFQRMNSEKIRLEDDLRKSKTSRDERVVAERSGFAEDAYDVLMERVRRGGGETSLKEIFDKLRRRNKKLKREKRDLERWLQAFTKKHRDLYQRFKRLEWETQKDVVG